MTTFDAAKHARDHDPHRDEHDATDELPFATVVRLDHVHPERVEWLWPGYLPAGKLVTLDGDPGLGKSTLALTVAAHVSTGHPWPDTEPCPVGDVVLMSAEDGLADTIRPRLDAAGADTTRVHALTAVPYLDDDGHIQHRPPVLPRDVHVLERLVTTTRARVIVVDVLMAYLDGNVNAHRDQDVRRALAPLARLADTTGATVLVLRHLNKSTGGPALYRGGGSIGIVGAARVGLVVAPDPDDDTDSRRVLAVAKNNLARPAPSRIFELVDSPESGTAHIEWLGTDSRHVDELLTHVDREERTERDDAAEWLRDYLNLEGGQAPSLDVKRDARKAGHSERTLQRALDVAGVTPFRSGFPSSTYWRLTDPTSHATPVATDATSPNTPTGGATASTGDDLGERGDPDGATAPVATVAPSVGSRDSTPLLDRPPCAECGDPMIVTEPGQTTHPGCDPAGGERQ